MVRGVLGGGSNGAGTNHRTGVAALLATCGPPGEHTRRLCSDAYPVVLHVEAGQLVDDIVDLSNETRACYRPS